jgi:hypothetical protein
VAPNVHSGCRVREISQEPGNRAGAADEELIREVRHAAGNLVQRMHYWTVLIEDQNTAAAAAESLAGLRTSLDSLHRLIVRSLDLLRTTELRPVSMPLADVVKGVTIRFGAPDGIDARDATAARVREVALDPLALERAVTMLAEALGAGPATNGRAAAGVTIIEDAADGAAELSLEWTADPQRADDPFTHVHARLALALALKLLDELGLATMVERHDDVVVVRITFPLRALTKRDARSLHSTSSPH